MRAINKMLELCELGKVDYFNKPNYYITQNEYVTLNVDITNAWYYNICMNYDTRKHNCSLASFIEWFCTEEIYVEYNFSTTYKKNTVTDEIMTYCDKLIKLLNIIQASGNLQKRHEKLLLSIREFYDGYGKECNTKNTNKAEDV